MSYSDFLIRTASGGSGNTGDQYTGSAALNSSLTNPLTSSINCRVLNEDNDTSGLISAFYLVSSSVSGGAFVNIDDTKSVSLRLWCRSNNQNENSTFSLLAKHNGYNAAYMDNSYNNKRPISGYEFGYQSNTVSYGIGPGQLYFKLGNYKTSAEGEIYERTEFLPVGYDKWVGLRMDIIPVKVNKIVNGVSANVIFKDVINFYTASYDTPDNWVQVGSGSYELPADGNRFVPWGSYTIRGSAYNANETFATVETSSYGFTVRCPKSNGIRTYFDDFQIFVEDAF